MNAGVPRRFDDPAGLLALTHTVADAVAGALATVTDWGPSGRREGQYVADLLADAAALTPLLEAGLSVVSEESGVTESGVTESGVTERGDVLLAVVDPLDGSTNASHGIPWFATSICILDEHGPLVALVADQSGILRHTTGPRWWAVRGGGAWRDGQPIAPSGQRSLDGALVAVSGLPPRHLGWRQFRALGAVALDLCHVADGTIDGFIDCSPDAHGSWDHGAAALICAEAGAVVADALARDLVPRDHAARRTPIAGATPELFGEIETARRSWM